MSKWYLLDRCLTGNKLIYCRWYNMHFQITTHMRTYTKFYLNVNIAVEFRVITVEKLLITVESLVIMA